MPTNLPPQYYKAEQRYRAAKTFEEKICILQEMLAIMPKHKGTDKIQADLRAKISKLKRTAHTKKGPHRSADPYQIPKQGAAQVILIGPPNTGKSSILLTLTRASPEIAPYPFTTHEPVVGMLVYENINIQLVDTPPIAEEFNFPWMKDILIRGELLLTVIDVGKEDVLEQVESVVGKLKDLNIKLAKEDHGEEVEKGTIYKKMVILANKSDVQGAEERLSILEEFYGEHFSIIVSSVKSPQKMEKVKKDIYHVLDIIRVYTKVPGRPPDMEDPVVLKKGSLVIDAAQSIHKDFARNLKYVRIWGDSKFDGQKVEKGHPLEEGDILEFHI